MTSFNETFERVEKKYRLTAEQRAALAPYLDAYMELGEYGKSTVTSLYLDTPDASLICRSLEKPLYKEKIRVRYYGQAECMTDDSAVFVELKKKFKGVVYKRRLRMSWGATKSFLAGEGYEQACKRFPLASEREQETSFSARSVQISREIEAFVSHHGPLQFSMSIACDRTAFSRRSVPVSDIPLLETGTGVQPVWLDDDLRITFDDNIRYARLDERGCGSEVVSLLPQGECIMEIKARGAFPLWLVRALSVCKIRPTSFSKYGESYKASRLCG